VGEHFSGFEVKSISAFWGEAFLVTNESDRMGYRLRGSAIKLKESVELISEATTNGAIQVLPDGQMIILLADRQTIGGYPKIAYLAGIDLPVVAQLKPGETIRFQEISLVEAQALFSQRERQIESIKRAVSLHD
jgi:antagonist of KipI